MSERIAIIGNSGEGKSTSIKDLDPATTAIINVMGKPLPFKGWRKLYKPIDPSNNEGNYHVTHKPDQIVKTLKYFSDKREDIKVVIIDDFQYIMSTEFMNRATEKGWEKFNEIGQNAWIVLYTAGNLRDDLKVIILAHDERVEEERCSGQGSRQDDPRAARRQVPDRHPFRRHRNARILRAVC